MSISFVKYSSTGNDFIVIDNRQEVVSCDDKGLWQKLCTRRNGIGADGVLLLENSHKNDFKMRYINADGGEVGMCGNGVLSITAFAKELGINKDWYLIETLSGVYRTKIDTNAILVKMDHIRDKKKIDLSDISPFKGIYVDTGVPHCIFMVEDVDAIDIVTWVKQRKNPRKFPLGTNSDFFQIIKEGELKVRFYERGVEDETLSCGTGAVAVAYAAFSLLNWHLPIKIHTRGGILKVDFDKDFNHASLYGNPRKIYTGMVN